MLGRVERGETRDSFMLVVHCGVSESLAEFYRHSGYSRYTSTNFRPFRLFRTDVVHIPDANPLVLLKFLISNLISTLWWNKHRVWIQINILRP